MALGPIGPVDMVIPEMKMSRVFLGMLLGGFSAAWACAQAAPPPGSNLSFLRDAAQSIAAGNLDVAESELQAVLRTSPGEYRALNLLGIVRAQQHHPEAAEQLFKQAIAQKPDFAGAHVDLGLLYVQTNRGGDAVPEFQEALRLDPTRTDARSALLGAWRGEARTAVQAHEFEKALALLIQARKVGPKDPNVLFDFGMVALQMSLYLDAEQAFREALAEQNDDPNTIYGLGRAQIGLAKFEDAKGSFEKYLRLRPEDASGHYALGFVLESLQQGAGARDQFERSIALQPAQTESYFQLGMMDLDQGKLDGASGRFRRVLDRDPKHAGALTGMGRVKFQQRDYADADALLERAVASDSSIRQAHYYLGLAYARLGRKDESEQELQIAGQLEHSEVEKQQTGLRLDSADTSDAGPSQTK
jgi:tetratricopeptide (TPR) repeat protein